jgi:hypothetical protein
MRTPRFARMGVLRIDEPTVDSRSGAADPDIVPLPSVRANDRSSFAPKNRLSWQESAGPARRLRLAQGHQWTTMGGIVNVPIIPTMPPRIQRSNIECFASVP